MHRGKIKPARGLRMSWMLALFVAIADSAQSVDAIVPQPQLCGAAPGSATAKANFPLCTTTLSIEVVSEVASPKAALQRNLPAAGGPTAYVVPTLPCPTYSYACGGSKQRTGHLMRPSRAAAIAERLNTSITDHIYFVCMQELRFGACRLAVSSHRRPLRPLQPASMAAGGF